MSDNVVVAVVAGCAVVVAAFCVLGASIFAYIASNKRLDKIDATLQLIQADIR
jgi:hypothetical protein